MPNILTKRLFSAIISPKYQFLQFIYEGKTISKEAALEDFRGNGNGNKELLDENRAPGQSYNGFIYQLVDLWKQNDEKTIRRYAYREGLKHGQHLTKL